MYAEAYRFDIEEKTLTIIPAETGTSEMCASDVMNNGTIVGMNDASHPAIYRNTEEGWVEMPMPEGEDMTGTLFQCTGDGKYLVGHVIGRGDSNNPYSVRPSLWTLQDDDTYKYEILPNPQVDFVGGKTQFISPRTISPDGNLIIGVMMEQNGFYSQAILYYKDESGAWTYETPFVEYSYNMDIYNEIMSREPKMSDYITVSPGNSEYMEQVTEFQIAYAAWQYELFTTWKKGPEFTSVPIIMSEDGKYLAPTVREKTYHYTEGETYVETLDTKYYPCRYDTQSKELVMMPEIPGFITYAISNYGDMLTGDGYNIYLLPNGAGEKIELTEWLKQNYNGYNLYDDLPSNTEYLDCQTIGSDMSLIVGTYRSTAEDGSLDQKEVFCIKLPVLNAIMETLNTPQSAEITVSENLLTFSGEASKVTLYNIAGQEIMPCVNATDRLDISRLEKGVYVASAVINGKEVKAKFYKK